MIEELENCLTKGECEVCGSSESKCPLDDKIFNFLTENNFDPYVMTQYHKIKTKFQDYQNDNDYSSCIFLSEIKRN